MISSAWPNKDGSKDSSPSSSASETTIVAPVALAILFISSFGTRLRQDI